MFREFDLKGEERFCEKRSQIALKYGLPWEKVEPYGVPRAIWKRTAGKKRLSDLRCLGKAALRKLSKRG